MCHNIQDGRYHTICRHFIAMSTRQHDCLNPYCIFSRRHVHQANCKSNTCIRLMSPPQKNPIRISETKCGDCIMMERNGLAPVGFV